MKNVAININGDGEITQQGGGVNRIIINKVSVGEYEILGTLGLANNGWKSSIYQDENGINTIKLSHSFNNGIFKLSTFDVTTNLKIDIINTLTLRFDVIENEATQVVE